MGPDHLVPVKAPGRAGAVETLPVRETVGTSSGWEAWQARHGGLSAPTLFTDTCGMALKVAVHGAGVALISGVLAQHAIRAGGVERAHPGQIEGREGYFLWSRPGHGPADTFRTWLEGCP